MKRNVRNGSLMILSITCSAAALVWAVRSETDRAYLYASLVIIALILIPFYISFEKDRPYARQIVLVSVMTALAVASRAAFFWIPQFKPIIAVIIIAGAALGAQSGFIVGSMSAFVSNFLFGQGPWTPFQMVAWGLIGMLAGLLFNRYFMGSYKPAVPHAQDAPHAPAAADALNAPAASQGPNAASKPGLTGDTAEKSVIPLMIYGAVSCFVLHGAITDIWTWLSISDRPTLGQLITVYSAGLIPDLVLAAATVLFLGLAAGPMLKKIRRVSMKYGMQAR